MGISNYIVMESIEWLEEPIKYLKRGNGLYKFLCFCIGRRRKKLSYKEMYMVLVELNRKSLGDEKAKKSALNRILQIYKDINNKLPNGIEE